MEHVVHREYPLLFWFFGAMFLVVDAVVMKEVSERVLMGLGGVGFIGFGSVLTVTVDRAKRTLTIRYRSLFRPSTRTYPFGEISYVTVSQDGEGERMYRVELVLRSGEVVPLRSGYSIGRARKERIAEKLRSALGISFNAVTRS
jgi:hypothetical protein